MLLLLLGSTTSNAEYVGHQRAEGAPAEYLGRAASALPDSAHGRELPPSIPGPSWRMECTDGTAQEGSLADLVKLMELRGVACTMAPLASSALMQSSVSGSRMAGGSGELGNEPKLGVFNA